MAKKKKQTRNRKKIEVIDKSPFWPMVGAVIMILLAIFTLLGAFNTGGNLPQGLYSSAYWMLGWSAILAPVALVYFGIIKFNSEDHQIPLGSLVSMITGVTLASSFFHVISATNEFADVGQPSRGGALGNLVGGIVLNAIDTIPAALMFFVFAVFAFFFAFGVSPKVILDFLGLFKTNKNKDTDLQALKQHPESSFKLNEGVPVEHHNKFCRSVARTGGGGGGGQKLT
ncbi:DNA translocase FtsK 4TM domain-containing protein, partial [Candidatus Saccharibacteria bacterium]|nr:DNA translocase FtsK 4TM domain-containing protein [Candidatus Saccharibacteria bacterium]